MDCLTPQLTYEVTGATGSLSIKETEAESGQEAFLCEPAAMRGPGILTVVC